MRPRFSFFGSAVRPEFWRRVVEALDQNESDYEIVFRGNVPPAPDQECPQIRWTYDDSSATECWELASRECSGELVSLLVDDYEYSPGCLDECWERWNAGGRDPMHVVSPRYVLDGEDRTSPGMPVGGFYERGFYRSLGGADRRFAGVAADVDIAMRAVFERGARVEHCGPGHITERRDWYAPEYTSLSQKFESTDHAFIQQLWVLDGNGWRRTAALEPIA